MRLTHLFASCGLLTVAAGGFAGELAKPTNAATWAHGFEAAEGYQVGPIVSGDHLSLTGGTAAILHDGAAEGKQFLRFVPQQAEDALVIRLPGGVRADAERTVGFALRLPTPAQSTRLVLSQHWTVALRPVTGGIEIETNETPPRRISLTLRPGDWLSLGLREHGSKDTWDLLVSGEPVLIDIPRQRAADYLADLLIFADGSLDLDAIALSAESLADTDSADQGGEGISKTSNHTTLMLQERSEWISRALAAARDGDYTLAVAISEKLARRGDDESAQNMDAAQLLSLIAYALRDGGLHEKAAALGRLALQPLERARATAAQKSQSGQFRASYEFVAAQINEQLLGDEAEASRLFRKTLEYFPEHEGAQGGEQRLARQRERAAKDQGLNAKDTPKNLGQGGAQ